MAIDSVGFLCQGESDPELLEEVTHGELDAQRLAERIDDGFAEFRTIDLHRCIIEIKALQSCFPEEITRDQHESPIDRQLTKRASTGVPLDKVEN